MNKEFKKVENLNEKNVVLYYENESAVPVIIRQKDIPKAICLSTDNAIITDILDCLICSTFGCFLNQLNPEYKWIREELIELQMNGSVEGETIEYILCN